MFLWKAAKIITSNSIRFINHLILSINSGDRYVSRDIKINRKYIPIIELLESRKLPIAFVLGFANPGGDFAGNGMKF